MKVRVCSIRGCNEKHEGRGYCRSHYKRFMRHGDPLVVKQGPRGGGWIGRKGHRNLTINGKNVPEHRLVAEMALGKKLPKGAVVHHIDENPLNNDPSNLVICPTAGYHRQLHARMDALKESGHADWQRCPYCHKHDDPKNMRREKVRWVHATCSAYAKRNCRSYIKRLRSSRVSIQKSR